MSPCGPWCGPQRELSDVVAVMFVSTLLRAWWQATQRLPALRSYDAPFSSVATAVQRRPKLPSECGAWQVKQWIAVGSTTTSGIVVPVALATNPSFGWQPLAG